MNHYPFLHNISHSLQISLTSHALKTNTNVFWGSYLSFREKGSGDSLWAFLLFVHHLNNRISMREGLPKVSKSNKKRLKWWDWKTSLAVPRLLHEESISSKRNTAYCCILMHNSFSGNSKADFCSEREYYVFRCLATTLGFCWRSITNFKT